MATNAAHDKRAMTPCPPFLRFFHPCDHGSGSGVPEQSARSPTPTWAAELISQFVTFARIFRAANVLIRLGNPAKNRDFRKSDFCGSIPCKGITPMINSREERRTRHALRRRLGAPMVFRYTMSNIEAANHGLAANLHYRTTILKIKNIIL